VSRGSTAQFPAKPDTWNQEASRRKSATWNSDALDPATWKEGVLRHFGSPCHVEHLIRMEDAFFVSPLTRPATRVAVLRSTVRISVKLFVVHSHIRLSLDANIL
jgi:hypothetical protein